ncbi:hypothetical protein [Aquimarina rhabdastrellae]
MDEKKNKSIYKQKIEFERERNLILEKTRIEKQVEYEKGYKEGTGSIDFLLQVEPYKNIIGKKGYLKSSQMIEIGYVYRLFVKGIPCLDPHIQIIEKINVREINEENVNTIIKKLETIINKTPNQYLKLVGNLKDFSIGILNLKNHRKLKSS